MIFLDQIIINPMSNTPEKQEITAEQWLILSKEKQELYEPYLGSYYSSSRFTEDNLVQFQPWGEIKSRAGFLPTCTHYKLKPITPPLTKPEESELSEIYNFIDHLQVTYDENGEGLPPIIKLQRVQQHLAAAISCWADISIKKSSEITALTATLQQKDEEIKRLKKALQRVQSMSANATREGNQSLRFYIKEVLGQD